MAFMWDKYLMEEFIIYIALVYLCSHITIYISN